MKNIIRNSLLLLATLLMCLSEGYTQSGWFSQASGTTNHLFGVWFTDANTGIVVGGLPTGCILRTTDAGTTWTPQSTGIENLRYLGAVCFSDSMNGWAVGDTVLHTTNGGNTWSTQFIGTNVQLEAVYCIDSNMVWAVGDSGTILHTTNGGATWTSQTSGTTNLLWGVFFTDADTGTIVGNGGIILRTTNGGVTWTSQNSGTTTTLGGVYFTDANTGTIVGSNGTILHTTNGGATWTSQESGSINQLWCVFFINADTGTVVGGPWPNGSVGGIILHTTNGGTTWTKQNIPTQKAIYRVFFTDANTGTAVGYDGTILCTLTGGEPPVGIENRQDELAWNLSLSQNYPNPFSSKTVISYQLPVTGEVELSVYDLIGRKVTTLVKERQQTGRYEIEWDAEGIKSGIYFCKLKAAKFEKTVKLIISQ